MAGGGCGCSGCMGGGLFIREKEAFEGLPYDMRAYLAGGLAERAERVRNDVLEVLRSGGIHDVKVEPYVIRMKQWFSKRRNYLLAQYRGVHVYILIIDFGKDLYVSWISFFKLGCLQRLARFGSAEPTDLDVDDLEMLGLAVDVQVRKVIDRNMQTAGEDQQSRDRILQGVRRKRFVKA